MAPLAVTLGIDRGVAGWMSGVIGQEAHHRRHDQQGCSASQSSLCRVREFSPSPVDYKVEVCLGEWPARYIVRIRTSALWDALPELAGLSLVCDCPLDPICEADILIGFYFDATSPVSDPRHRGTDGKWSRTVALLQGIQALPKSMSSAYRYCPMSQRESYRLRRRMVS